MKNYFNVFFKSWYFVLSLVLASLFITFVCTSYSYGTLNAILSNKVLLTVLAVLFSILAVAVLVYMVLSLKKTKLTIADSLFFALILIGVAFFIFVSIAIKSFNLNRFTTLITFLTFGIFFSIIRIHQYTLNLTKTKEESKEN